jgi:hypothetical protein
VAARIKKAKAEWMRKPEIKARYYEHYRRRDEAKRWYLMLAKAKLRCKKSGHEFALTSDWAIAKWTGRCELTGIEFDHRKGVTTMRSPSLDRIDSSIGYVESNCRFILWGLNRFKGADTDADMRAIAHALLESK